MSVNVLGCVCQAETFQTFENLRPEGNSMISHNAFLQNSNPRNLLHNF